MRGLLILAILALVVVTLWPLLKQLRLRLPGGSGDMPHDELVKDPMCETYVVLSRAVRRDVGGVSTFFCSAKCADRYYGLGPRS